MSSGFHYWIPVQHFAELRGVSYFGTASRNVVGMTDGLSPFLREAPAKIGGKCLIAAQRPPDPPTPRQSTFSVIRFPCSIRHAQQGHKSGRHGANASPLIPVIGYRLITACKRLNLIRVYCCFSANQPPIIAAVLVSNRPAMRPHVIQTAGKPPWQWII